MLITENKSVTAPLSTLPPLIKQSSTFKLFVPAKVEEKIRYLIRKYPHTEWSGVLFYTHTGSFEDNNLEIHCEDIYPMDLGSSSFTQFKMSPDVTAYIADNIELFDCETGILHSHHTMGSFFSSTDLDTLRSEGNDTNCFVSLIVDTKGTYVAAITRKMKSSTEVTVKPLSSSYQFFGNGPVCSNIIATEKTDTITKEAIEYFMLDVEREVVDNPLEYLDYRFNEIERKKEALRPVSYQGVNMDTPGKDEEFFNWIHSSRKASAEAKEAVLPSANSLKQPSLFSEEVMDGLIDASKWEPDPTIIHHLAVQMVTSSLIVNPDIDLKQWVTRHMVKKYTEIFSDHEEFRQWADSMVDFIVNHYGYIATDIPDELYDDLDACIAKVSQALISELEEYPSNPYIEEYIDLLNARAYE